MDAQDLVEMMQMHGLEYVCRRFFSPHKAVVVSNKDPDQLGRVRLACPAVGHREDDPPDEWVIPMFQMAGPGFGEFYPPEEGTIVNVFFENGNANTPAFYVGGWYGSGELPQVSDPATGKTKNAFAYSANGYPERRGMVTRTGHQLMFCDEKDKGYVRLLWHGPDAADKALTDHKIAADPTKGDFSSITLNEKGDVFVTNKKSSFVHLDAENNQVMVALSLPDKKMCSITLRDSGVLLSDKSGNVIEINSGSNGISIITKQSVNIVGEKVNVKAGTVYLGENAASSAVLGEALRAYLDTHTHPTSSGPSGPPSIPTTPAILSKGVRVGS